MVYIRCKKFLPEAKLLNKAHDSDVAYDVHIIADDNWPLASEYTLQPGERRTFRTGFQVEAPDNYGFLLRDRSGLAVKQGLHILAGVIEGTYRGEWMVCAINLGNTPIIIKPGDKIAQAVLTEILPSRIVEVEELGQTERGEKGFGSSGR